jgi:hypothetical protein
MATVAAPGWLAALAKPFGHKPGDKMAVCGDLCEAALAADWSVWLGHMQRLEQTLFAPTLAALMQGQHSKVKLVLGHRSAHKEFITTKLGQRAFWRAASLNPLLP